MLAGEEKVYLEEERSRIIARVDDLKRRVGELERQLQETRQEVSCRAGPSVFSGPFWTDCVGLQAEMEQALLQAEKQAEREQAEADNDTVSQLQLKLSQLDTSTRREKEKVGTEGETVQLRAPACQSVFEWERKPPP